MGVWGLGRVVLVVSWRDAEVPVVEVDKTEKADEPEDDLDEGVVVKPERDTAESDDVDRWVGRVGGVSGIGRLDTAASIDASGGTVSSRR